MKKITATNAVHFRRASLRLDIIIIAAVAGLLVTLGVLFASTGFRLHREAKIRANLQTVWVTANQYLLQHSKDEVTLTDLAAYTEMGVTPLSKLATVAGEDYAAVNGGTISRDDTRLTLAYGKDGKVVYETKPTPKSASKSAPKKK
ncbi:MAG: hypothetical protein LBT53_01320 [Puniceicoccales bacterium]|jgi:hypothetical protein|nr:hypothetical protein [Puniceicoccales bacterium]